MTLNTVPKFGKVELLLKETHSDQVMGSVTKLEFDDCGLMISGDYIVVIIDEKGGLDSKATTTGEIFHLSQIKAYKTYSE